jgi:hypothetical protein
MEIRTQFRIRFCVPHVCRSLSPAKKWQELLVGPAATIFDKYAYFSIAYEGAAWKYQHPYQQDGGPHIVSPFLTMNPIILHPVCPWT